MADDGQSFGGRGAIVLDVISTFALIEPVRIKMNYNR